MYGYLVPVYQNKELYDLLIKRLEKLGWKNTINSQMALSKKLGSLCLIIQTCGEPGSIVWSDSHTYHNWKTIGIEDLFKDETYKWVKPTKEVKLNAEYTAVIDSEGVKVGCQRFSIDKLKELVSAAKEYGYSL